MNVQDVNLRKLYYILEGDVKGKEVARCEVKTVSSIEYIVYSEEDKMWVVNSLPVGQSVRKYLSYCNIQDFIRRFNFNFFYINT